MKLLLKIKSNTRKSLLALFVGLFIISGASIVYLRHSKAVTATTDSLVATKASTPKTSTKLSFSDQTNLPKTYTPGQNITVSFVIQNHEGKQIDYPYVVTINGKQAAGHTVTVKDRTLQTVKELLTLPSDQQALTIEVKLTGQDQAIHFLVDRVK